MAPDVTGVLPETQLTTYTAASEREADMRLTPPTIPIFLISIVVAVLAVGDSYYHVPSVHGFIAAHRFAMVVTAYVILAIGVIFPGL